MQEYLDAKMHIMERTTGTVVINSQVQAFAHEYGLEINLSDKTRLYQGGGIDMTDGDNIIISGRKKYKFSESQLSGMHNALNILSVGIVASEMGICSKRVREYLRQISGLPHRLEKVGEKNGIVFVEDSKSTSSQSLEAALGSYGQTKNLLLIVGGSDKGDVFIHLAPKFRERVKAMVCIGATKSKFIQIAEIENISYLSTDILVDGVNWLYAQGVAGDIVMLSPGCASFGLFQNYLDRALQFRDSIKNLP